MTDIQAGMERMRALANRINELDPYYRFDVAVRNDTVEVTAALVGCISTIPAHGISAMNRANELNRERFAPPH